MQSYRIKLRELVPALAVGLALSGCGGGEPTAGEPTAEQLEIIRKNEPSPKPHSAEAAKLQAGGASGRLGAH